MSEIFDLGAVLMVAFVARGGSCPTARLDDLAALVNYMTHGPRVPYDPVIMRLCGASILEQHAWIGELELPDFNRMDEAQKEAWLEELEKQHGPVMINPLAQALERGPTDFALDAAPPEKIIAVADLLDPRSVEEVQRIMRGEPEEKDHD